MNPTDAINLQIKWGDEPCDHPDAIAVTSSDGIPSNIWRCTHCGRIVDIDAWMNARIINKQ
jgi:ribosomal protein L37AE/L43A